MNTKTTQTRVEEVAQKIQDLYFHSGAKISKATWDKTLELVSQAKEEGAREERERVEKEVLTPLYDEIHEWYVQKKDVVGQGALIHVFEEALQTLSNNT